MPLHINPQNIDLLPKTDEKIYFNYTFFLILSDMEFWHLIPSLRRGVPHKIDVAKIGF